MSDDRARMRHRLVATGLKLAKRQIPGFDLPQITTTEAVDTTDLNGTATASPTSSTGNNSQPALYFSGDKWTPAKVTAVVVPLVLVAGVIVAFFVLSFRRRRVVNAERKLTDELWTQRGGTDRKAGDKRLSSDSLVAYVEEKPPRAAFMRESLSPGLASRDSIASFASSLDSAVDDSRYRPASMIRSPSASSFSMSPDGKSANPFEDGLISGREARLSKLRDDASTINTPPSPGAAHSEEAISEEAMLVGRSYRRGGH